MSASEIIATPESQSDTPPQTPYSDGSHTFFRQPDLSLVAPWEEPGIYAETVGMAEQTHIPILFGKQYLILLKRFWQPCHNAAWNVAPPPSMLSIFWNNEVQPILSSP
jgi:hypothetical protein